MSQTFRLLPTSRLAVSKFAKIVRWDSRTLQRLSGWARMSSQVSFLRQIHAPSPPESAIVDIVAVHGLSPLKNPNHAEDTWTAKTSGKMWLRDFLPHNLPNSRIFLFGYNANAALSTSTAGVQDQAQVLFSRLLQERRSAPERPLLFICHSLGGLIVKTGLYMCQLNRRLMPVYEATYGLIFFATPHRGGRHASLGDIAASIAKALLSNPSNNYLEALKSHSYSSEILRDNFMERQGDFHVCTFFETLPMPGIGIVVDKSSAVLGLPGEREVKYAINANHSTICKFEREDGDDYRLVWLEIKDLVESATKNAERLMMLQEAAVPQTSLVNESRSVARPFFPAFKAAHSVSLHYVHRPELFQGLEERFGGSLSQDDQAKVVLLHGLAGSGKTQIAMQYATKWLRTNRFCYLFDAFSLGNLNASFKRFAIASGLSSTPQGGKESVGTRLPEGASLPLSSQQVLHFVSQLTEQWLLIFDNYDLPAKDRFYLRSYFPEGSNGQIIVTSRNKDVEEDIGGKALQVDKMSSDEALQLLLLSGDINIDATNREATELGEMVATELLGSLPLAIAQGGAFIKQRIRRSRTAIDRLHEYQNLFEQHQAEMLDGRYKGLETLVRQYGKSVITSWDMSFKVVISDSPTAAQLFLFLGFLHHAGIPSELFETAHKFKSKFEAHDRIDVSKAPYHWLGEILSSDNRGGWDRSIFDISMLLLESFSLVQCANEGYYMHPLVHTWTRFSKIDNQDIVDARAQLAIATLAKVHKRDVNRQSVQRQLIQTRWSGHLASCITSTAKHTNILDPESQSNLHAVTLLRIANVLDNELLSPELRAKKLPERLVILALMSGAQKNGLDNISTIQSLRNILVPLGGDSRYASAAEPLTSILPALLPIAAASDPEVDVIEQELSFLFTRLGYLRTLKRDEELRTTQETILSFLENHREQLGTLEYLYKKTIILNTVLSGIENDALPEFLQIIENLIADLERNLTEADWYYVLIAKKIKGTCLGRLGKKEEAIAMLRSLITEAKAYPGVSNNLVSQCTHALNQFLIRREEWHEICENSRYLLGRISKELGPYHEDALLEKRRVIDYDRKHLIKTGVLGRETWGDPKVFGTDHCLELSDDTITITLELAIAYKAFGMESKIQPLWDGVSKQIRDEQAGEELISLYIKALEFAMDAAHRQGYHYFGLLLKIAIAGMEKARDDFSARGCEPRLEQLENLRSLWNDLESFYEVHKQSPQSPSTLHIAESVLRTVRHARKSSQPSILFLINHFLQWMIQSDLCTTLAPVPCNILEGIQELMTSNFGHWKDSNNTMESTVNLVVSQRLLGEDSKALETEDEMVRCRIQEEKSEPRFIPGRRSVNLFPATLGIERLHIEYRRREWFSASMRLYQIVYNDFVISLGIQAPETVLTMKLLCEMYGRVSELSKLQNLLSNLEIMFQDGDTAKKQQILDTLTAVSSWCYSQNQYEIAWHLILFLIRLYWPIASQSWRIQIAKDAEIVARKTGRLEEIPDIVEARERIELVIKTGDDLAAATNIPEDAMEDALPVEAGSLQRRFRLISEKFSTWRAKKKG